MHRSETEYKVKYVQVFLITSNLWTGTHLSTQKVAIVYN